ncbi:phosphocholine-specific phospholipase C [Belliella marina]|uniref:phospholipase C n=1 Tax=Belliella marina TaxID=1644146 RepID=A0ABW4VQ36_9BACT
MNDSRRDFIKKAALLAGGVSVGTSLPVSIQKALAIQTEKGSSFYDAEHVVFLMQENRSFDHCFGALKGVRGFNDPRTIRLPNGNPVWFQPDNSGKSFPPFRLNIKDTRATWLGDLPHSWEDQVDAYNSGKFDNWILSKKPWNREFNHIPLTMGYYQRQDIPFYYALADAFTVADQHFCSTLTGTTTNRMYFWTGKSNKHPADKVKVRNSEIGYNREVDWLTFPEVLEDNNISWKIYQNEVSIKTELQGEDESLLGNFTDNNLEWFKQYQIRFSPGHINYLQKVLREIPVEIDKLEKFLEKGEVEDINEANKQLGQLKNTLDYAKKTLKEYSPEAFDRLDQRARNLHQKAFATNSDDPNYHRTETLGYVANGKSEEVKIPKGDILHGFRKDVESGSLPTVSWLVAPQKFSDHPSAPWYGAWYVSEVMDILTKNPEVWKKTIFILNYDENDGYFDHVPPYVAPNEKDLQTGKISQGLSTLGEFVTKNQELEAGFEEKDARESPVGLGYRVPLVVASPWSKGGWVNSQVCDLTSSLMFLEKFLSKKTGKKIHCPNISSWRREICGDLTSMFRKEGNDDAVLKTLVQAEHMKGIHQVRKHVLPENYMVFDTELVKTEPVGFVSPQEIGVKPSNIIPYENHCDLEIKEGILKLNFSCGTKIFGSKSIGAPFKVFAPSGHRNKKTQKILHSWDFAVKKGDHVGYDWELKGFDNDMYDLRVQGPNGFWRGFRGKSNMDTMVQVKCEYEAKRFGRAGILLIITNLSTVPQEVKMQESTYRKTNKTIVLKSGQTKTIGVETSKTKGWYDFNLSDLNGDFEWAYAGRMDMNKPSITDPLLGRVHDLQYDF